ncbi:MAG TPA: Holliday junction branch migration protein RuvA [Candidatus Paceibacterota bacterium]|nr:Holliday junction branch migration protein RuvA [Candidatus Paceibacterota bacterium]
MIGYIEGIVIENSERGVVILTKSGIGYLVSVNRTTLEKAKVDTDIALWIHTVVREDALDLYGFHTEEELRFFKMLTTVSGIGPKSACNILSLADLKTIIHAIQGGDASYLTKVSGIGKKNAEKIVLELRDKLENFAITFSTTASTSTESEVIDALEALGYEPRATREVVRTLARENLSTQEIIRAALQQLGK